jgi:hypothetical protein
MYIWEKLFSSHGLEYIIAGGAFFIFIFIFKLLKPKSKF